MEKEKIEIVVYDWRSGIRMLKKLKAIFPDLKEERRAQGGKIICYTADFTYNIVTSFYYTKQIGMGNYSRIWVDENIPSNSETYSYIAARSRYGRNIVLISTQIDENE